MKLFKEQQESYENAKICYVCTEKFNNKYFKDKNILKLELLSFMWEYRGPVHSSTA